MDMSVMFAMFFYYVQVFRIPAGGTKPDLELGERFINGDDSFHFCKPADVAVLTSGEFFVSDGWVELPTALLLLGLKFCWSM